MEQPTLPKSPSPLRGLRVLDASRVLAGPYCGQLLGDLGADVLKIEKPGVGDDTRTWGPPFHPSGPTAYYLSCNRNKRGVAIDLADPRGRDVFHQLARNADIVLENFLAPSAQKLGLSPAQLFNVNPRLILCSISGFGRTGPMAGLPGYDFAIQAMSGLLSITGPVGGPPSKVGVAITDVLTGVYAATVVLACLHARQTSGHGYAVDLALLDCAIASQVNVVQAYLARLDAGESPEQANPQPQGNAHLQIVPYQLFATADAHLVVAVGNDEQWRRFAEAVMVELRDDARFATNPDRVRNRAVLIPLLEERMKTKTTAEWIARLEPLSVPHAPLWRYSELFAQEQATARNWRVTVRDPKGQPVDLVGSPFHISTPHSSSQQQEPSYAMPPEVGQHTEEVLREWAGFKLEDLAKLRSSGVIA